MVWFHILRNYSSSTFVSVFTNSKSSTFYSHPLQTHCSITLQGSKNHKNAIIYKSPSPFSFKTLATILSLSLSLSLSLTQPSLCKSSGRPDPNPADPTRIFQRPPVVSGGGAGLIWCVSSVRSSLWGRLAPFCNPLHESKPARDGSDPVTTRLQSGVDSLFSGSCWT